MNFRGAFIGRVAALAFLIFQSIVTTKAATFTVTSLANSGPGSLRDQIAASLAGDTIQFAVTGTIVLNSAITIDHTLFVQGPGAGSLVVNANLVDRAFITTGYSVTFSGMTIKNGFVQGFNGPDATNPGQNGGPGLEADGGAILDQSYWLNLSNIWITSSRVQGGHGGFGGPNYIGLGVKPGNGGDGGPAGGGAIWGTGRVYVINCTFSANRVSAGMGGTGGTNFNPGVNESGGIGGNGGNAQGGAIDLPNGVPKDARVILNSTFSGNRVAGAGGGPGGDSADGSGGKGGDGQIGGGGAIGTIFVNLYGCTIISNSAYGGPGGAGGNGPPQGAFGSSAGGTAGGVIGYGITCQSEIENTILADNYADGTYSNYFIGFNDDGYNFISTFDYQFCGPLSPSTHVGTALSPLHPQLGPLAQNGGGAPTHSTTLTSPVTDQGIANPGPFDERGAPRPYDVGSIPNASGGDSSDIGAFELGVGDPGLGKGSNNVVVSWPAYYGDLILQMTTNLQASGPWNTVTDTPTVTGSLLMVTNPATGRMKFYRLATP